MCRSQEVNALPQTDSDDEVEVEEMKLKLKMEPSHSARGVWNYTVGLVGKPSAGQNIIYHHLLFSSLLFYIFFITPYVTQFCSSVDNNLNKNFIKIKDKNCVTYGVIKKI